MTTPGTPPDLGIQLDHLVIAGLHVQVYTDPKVSSTTEVAVLFLLHGRGGTSQDVKWVAESVLNQIAEKRETVGGDLKIPALVVVAFDQRNHGTRLVDPIANEAWSKNPKKNNPRHAIDMYSMFVGTSRDVSFLIDFLPSYLYPNDEKSVTQWLVAGISLGGHSTWVTLRNEPRVRLGIPIIGCADYVALMSRRASRQSIPFQPPFVPSSLLATVQSNDAAGSSSNPPSYTSPSPNDNSFIGKKILMLSGGADDLVPASASEVFFEALNVGENGVKKVVIAPGVGHKCTPEMVKEMVVFIWKESLTV